QSFDTYLHLQCRATFHGEAIVDEADEVVVDVVVAKLGAGIAGDRVARDLTAPAIGFPPALARALAVRAGLCDLVPRAREAVRRRAIDRARVRRCVVAEAHVVRTAKAKTAAQGPKRTRKL